MLAKFDGSDGVVEKFGEIQSKGFEMGFSTARIAN
jgi:hypothetical protein